MSVDVYQGSMLLSYTFALVFDAIAENVKKS